jgi:putative membrane protein insertion efficiency factor
MTDVEAQMPHQLRNSSGTIKALKFRYLDLIWHLKFTIFVVATCFILSLFIAPCVSASALRGPWSKDSHKRDSQKHGDFSGDPFGVLVELYRSTISPIDGKNCPMYPSCSEYSIRCFNKHGFFVGWVMTCDRLLRCGRDELRLAPQIRVQGKPRCYDPPENNDFWWYNGP